MIVSFKAQSFNLIQLTLRFKHRMKTGLFWCSRLNTDFVVIVFEFFCFIESECHIVNTFLDIFMIYAQFLFIWMERRIYPDLMVH